jgi:hypothetical protein
VAGAARRDLGVEAEYGVRYWRYWLDEASGKIFCLAEGPDAAAAMTVDREAHGLLADRSTPVEATI